MSAIILINKKMKFKNWFHLHWFSKWYWKYLLEKSKNPTYTTRIKRFICRVNKHPNGVWWYNCSGTEPDMKCKTCHDDLG